MAASLSYPAVRRRAQCGRSETGGDRDERMSRPKPGRGPAAPQLGTSVLERALPGRSEKRDLGKIPDGRAGSESVRLLFGDRAGNAALTSEVPSGAAGPRPGDGRCEAERNARRPVNEGIFARVKIVRGEAKA